MTVQTVSPRDIFTRRQAGEKLDIIDVRTPAEFATVHAEGARLIPLDQLDPRTITPNGPIFFICKSGSRAANACSKMLSAGFSNVFNIEGGTTAWESAGLPVVRGTSKVISLERQVRIAAGVLILIGAALTWLIHPLFILLPAFVGAGLTFSGITDFCGMGILLGKMPWNRRA